MTFAADGETVMVVGDTSMVGTWDQLASGTRASALNPAWYRPSSVDPPGSTEHRKPMHHNQQHPQTINLNGARLRPLRADDAAAFYAYLKDPAVTELTSYPVISLSMVEAMIERYRNRWATGELSKWGIALPDNDEIVGTCGFNDWSKVHCWAELAFDLAPAYWGRGLMREAVAAVLQWMYQQDQVDRVHAFVRVDNTRSARLLERSGFVQEGRLRHYRVCRGQPHDFYIYGLLRSDWEAS